MTSPLQILTLATMCVFTACTTSTHPSYAPPSPALSVREIAVRALSKDWQRTAKIISTGKSRIVFHGDAIAAPGVIPPKGEWRGVVRGEVLHLYRGTVGVGSYLVVGDGLPDFQYGEATQSFHFSAGQNGGYGLRPLTQGELDQKLRDIAFGGSR